MHDTGHQLNLADEIQVMCYILMVYLGLCGWTVIADHRVRNQRIQALWCLSDWQLRPHSEERQVTVATRHSCRCEERDER